MHSSLLEIKEVRDPDSWDRSLLQTKKSEYTHLFKWSRVIEETYNHKPVFLAAVIPDQNKKEELRGILPLFRFKTMVNASRFALVLFFDTAGILAQDVTARIFIFKNGLETLLK